MAADTAPFVNAIAALAEKAQIPTTLALNGNRPDRKLVILKGEAKEYQAPPDFRRQIITSLDSLADAALEHEATAAIWIGEEEVRVLFDGYSKPKNASAEAAADHAFRGQDATEWATMATPLSPQLEAIRDNDDKLLTQQQAVRFLMVGLFGCEVRPKDLLESIRKVDFKQVAEAQGERRQGKVSLGKKIESTMTGAEGLPEVVTVQLPYYANPRLVASVSVSLAFEIDPATEKFKFTAMPGELARAEMVAQDRVQHAIKALLDEAKIPFFFGKPTE